MKKNILLAILILFVFLLSSCAKVQYDFVIFEDGTIAETFSVDIDSSMMLSAGYNHADIQELKAKIQDDCRDILEEKEMIYVSQYRTMPEVIADNKLKNYFEYGIEYSIELEGDLITCQILYADYYLFCFFNNQLENYTNDGFTDEQVEEKLFYTKTTYTKGNFLKQSTLRTQIINSYKINYPFFNENSVNYIYRYGLSSSRWHSDADYVDYNGVNYYHTWQLSYADLNEDLLLYKIEANYWPWFALGMSASFLFTSILIFISIIKNKSKRKK